ncbi:hypothetical protein AKJ09_02542 [Labilithrix luteola]|uniref:Uncharacterized protein n=1 Tax=Labilithrix luteola TaxID=1391654 RepID=A0A0K1PQS1_9BACT|nr:hypothetical protein AKJ09_02542 [Labilithrix luteola]
MPARFPDWGVRRDHPRRERCAQLVEPHAALLSVGIRPPPEFVAHRGVCP